MFIQKMLARIDSAISLMFKLEFWILGSTSGPHERLFYLNSGKRIGIVGTDGTIRTIMGYWTVMHECDGSKVLRRVLVRKDLLEGERLATEADFRNYDERRRVEMKNSSGLTIGF